MPRLRLVAPAAVAAAVLVIVLASSGSAQQPGERTLTFTERDTAGTFKLIDIRPKNRRGTRNPRLSIGDSFAFRGPLFDAANQSRVGEIGGTCTFLKSGTFETATSHCIASMRLADGSIAFQGFVRFGSRTTTIAVVGGTGAYEGARGSLRSTEGRRTSTDVVHLLP